MSTALGSLSEMQAQRAAEHRAWTILAVLAFVAAAAVLACLARYQTVAAQGLVYRTDHWTGAQVVCSPYLCRRLDIRKNWNDPGAPAQ